MTNAGKRSAAEIARPVKLSDRARPLLDARIDPDAFVTRLIKERLYPDAIRFTAYRLPKPEAIWWGTLCVWEALRPEPAPAAGEALQAVIDWLKEPVEIRRRAAEVAAEPAGADTPAGTLALAVFMSGGSIAPPKLPNVAPDPHVTPKMVANAVLMASRTSDQEAARQRQFLQFATDVLDGRSRWDARPAATTT